MTLDLIVRHYPKPLDLNVQFYSNTQSVIRHFYKHTFNKQESNVWLRLLPINKEPFNHLNRKKYIRVEDDGIEIEGPCEINSLQECYNRLVDFLDRELAYPLREPLVMRTQEVTIQPYTGNQALRITYHLMSEHGLLIIIRGDVVRTAFFSIPRGNSTAFYDLYWSGLQELLETALRIRSGKSWYNVDENLHTRGLSVEQIRPGNFSNKNNPWPSTNTSLKKAASRKRGNIEKIALKYFEDR